MNLDTLKRSLGRAPLQYMQYIWPIINILGTRKLWAFGDRNATHLVRRQLASGPLDLKIGEELHWLLPNPFIMLTDLRRIHAIEGLPQDIHKLRLRIGRGYEARLLNILLGSLRRRGVRRIP